MRPPGTTYIFKDLRSGARRLVFEQSDLWWNLFAYPQCNTWWRYSSLVDPDLESWRLWSVEHGHELHSPLPMPPGAATLVSPNGNITTNNPTYTWNKVSDATWYYLYVRDPQAMCLPSGIRQRAVCGASTCSIANATDPGCWSSTAGGSRPGIDGGYGPWSTGMSFTTVTPAAATLNTPNGVTTNNPTYNWNKVSAATWYNLYVSGPSGYVFTQTGIAAGCLRCQHLFHCRCHTRPDQWSVSLVDPDLEQRGLWSLEHGLELLCPVTNPA